VKEAKKDAENAIASLKAKITGVKDAVVDNTKSLVDKVKGMSANDKNREEVNLLYSIV